MSVATTKDIALRVEGGADEANLYRYPNDPSLIFAKRRCSLGVLPAHVFIHAFARTMPTDNTFAGCSACSAPHPWTWLQRWSSESSR